MHFDNYVLTKKQHAAWFSNQLWRVLITLLNKVLSGHGKGQWEYSLRFQYRNKNWNFAIHYHILRQRFDTICRQVVSTRKKRVKGMYFNKLGLIMILPRQLDRRNKTNVFRRFEDAKEVIKCFTNPERTDHEAHLSGATLCRCHFLRKCESEYWESVSTWQWSGYFVKQSKVYKDHDDSNEIQAGVWQWNSC